MKDLPRFSWWPFSEVRILLKASSIEFSRCVMGNMCLSTFVLINKKVKLFKKVVKLLDLSFNRGYGVRNERRTIL